jgi:hypothetical protein
MFRMERFIRALVILIFTVALTAATGCSLFQPQQPKKPLTVEDWMLQPRIQP